MKNIKLKIEHVGNPPEVIITGNADGLRYLAEVCNRIVGKSGPAGHWHLMKEMGTLQKGSIDATIYFEEN